jgi:hypothetical protein
MGQLPAFEELVELADKDPEAFDAFRQQTCRQYIQSTAGRQQHRLLAIQNRVEMTLRRAKTPLEGIISISNMMYDSLGKLDNKLQEIQRTSENRPFQVEPKRRAQIIELERWRASH